MAKKKRKAGEAPTEFYDARALNPAPPTKRKRKANPTKGAKKKARASNPATPLVRTTIDARTLALASRLLSGG